MLVIWLFVSLWVTRSHASYCARIINYDYENGNLQGIVTVRPPPSYQQGDDFKLTLQFVIQGSTAQGQGNDPMKLSLAEDVSLAANKIKSARPVMYYLSLPSVHSVPIVKKVSVNGYDICRENHVPWGNTYTLSHTLKLAGHDYRGHKPEAPANLQSRHLPLQSYFKNQNQGGCEDIYSEIERGNSIFGIVKAPPPTNRNPADRVITELTFKGENEPGQMQLLDGLDDVSAKLRANRNDDLRYIVEFPVPFSIPKIVKVTVNGKEVCKAYPDVSPYTTTYTQSHTVIPVSGNSYAPYNIRPQPPYFRPVITSPPAIGTTALLPRLPNLEVCGTKESVNKLVVGGSEFPAGFWPWLVGIFVRSGNAGPTFQCGGSLVTMQHIVTAAHCIFLTIPNVRALRENDLRVALGLHSITNFEEVDRMVQHKRVAKTILHPMYNMDQNSDYDIAVLVLDSPAIFTPRVQPVCAWSSVDNNLVGKTGVVIGWGMDNNTAVTETPRSIVVPVVSRTVCRESDDIFKQRITEHNFCAGNRNGKGPCNGDSGGGLYFQEKAEDASIRWVLRGVVSFSKRTEKQFSCDLSHFVAYVDVNRFAKWINGIIN